MKKLFAFLAAALLAVPAFSQVEDLDLTLAQSNDEVVSFEMVDHIGYGFNIAQSDAFEPKTGSHFFVNVFNLNIRPAENFGISIGADYVFNTIRSEKSAFFVDENKKVQAIDFGDMVGSKAKKMRSNIEYSSFSFPVLLKGLFGDFHIGAGAEAVLNFGGHTYTSYQEDNNKYEITQRKAKLNTFTFDAMAFISYNELGAFVKYYPKSSKVLAEGSVDYSYWTIGVVIGF